MLQSEIMRCLLLLIIFLSGCAFRPQVPAPGVNEVPPFRPATMPPANTATPIPPPVVVLRPTPELACTDQLVFVSDVTIPDGTEVAANASLDKRWEVQNAGTCNWDERYQLRLSKQDKQLFGAWAKTYPVDAWETQRDQRIIAIQGNGNPFVSDAGHLQQYCQGG